MFTGIIEQVGRVVANTPTEAGTRLTIKANFSELEAGESIAVNGVCLTWLPASGSNLCFDVSPETMEVTCIGELAVGDIVNLERAMLASTRFGGHYVSGHVDTIARVLRIKPVEDFVEMIIGGFQPTDYLYLIPKGSITMEGVSLTINKVSEEGISLMLVPHTLENTTLHQFAENKRVNVEFDYLTRIVAHQQLLAGNLK